ncbi:MAG: hypothetical protein WBG62_16710 [Cyclobacteriaceae bacterium]
MLKIYLEHIHIILSGGNLSQSGVASTKFGQNHKSFTYAALRPDGRVKLSRQVSHKMAEDLINDYMLRINSQFVSSHHVRHYGIKELFPVQQLRLERQEPDTDSNGVTIGWQCYYKLVADAGYAGSESEVKAAGLDITIDMSGRVYNINYRLPLLHEPAATEAFTPPVVTNDEQEVIYVYLKEYECYAPFYYLKTNKRLLPASSFSFPLVSRKKASNLHYKSDEPDFFRDNRGLIMKVLWGMEKAVFSGKSFTQEVYHWQYADTASTEVTYALPDRREVDRLARGVMQTYNTKMLESNLIAKGEPPLFPLNSLKLKMVIPKFHPSLGHQYGWRAVYILYLKNDTGDMLPTLRAFQITIGYEGHVINIKSRLPAPLKKTSITPLPA